MTPNEIQMLLVGLALGVQGMACLNLYWNWRDDHRDRKAARDAARERAAA